jgi:pilus assembly protein CpaF
MTLRMMPGDGAFRSLQEEVRELLRRLPPEEVLAADGAERLRRRVQEVVQEYSRRRQLAGYPPLAGADRLAEELLRQVMGAGPLQPLLDDPEVEEIMVNAPDNVLVIRKGRVELAAVFFHDDDEVLELAQRLVGLRGERLDYSQPVVDVMLPDRARLHAVIPPISEHVALTIRKYTLRAEELSQLVELGTITPDAARFLEALVLTRKTILVVGGTSSGKTTMVNCLGNAIPPTERVVTIEDRVRELRFGALINWVPLVTRGANVEGQGEVTMQQLVREALRMRPDRIVIGETRGAEALDFLRAVTSDHPGSLSTIHASGGRHAMERVRVYAQMDPRLAPPPHVVDELVAEGIQFVVHMARVPGSDRRQVVSIWEATGMEREGPRSTFVGNDIFRRGEDGQLHWTGIRPRCAREVAHLGPFPWDGKSFYVGDGEVKRTPG